MVAEKVGGKLGGGGPREIEEEEKERERRNGGTPRMRNREGEGERENEREEEGESRVGRHSKRNRKCEKNGCNEHEKERRISDWRAYI